MNRTKYLAGKIGIVLCSALLGQAAHGQPSVEVGVSVPLPSVEVEIHAESDFYEPLAPQGEWVVIGSYGRCWRPARVARDWRPYCNGRWERTDAGWYWVSDEPWAWATYHYGRWDFTDEYGWYWVPQIQWAPAWVSWHEGGGYVGWAPLHPSVRISASGYVGLNVAVISPRAFVFVEHRQFLNPIRPATVVVNNTTIINKTVIITNTKLVNNTVINEGPAPAVIEKASGRKVQAVAVRELRHKEEAPVAAKKKATGSSSEKKAGASPGSKPSADTDDSGKAAPRNSEAPREKKQPTLDKPPTGPKADKQGEQPERPAKAADEKVQKPGKEKPAANEKGGGNPGDKDQEKKSKGKPQ